MSLPLTYGAVLPCATHWLSEVLREGTQRQSRFQSHKNLWKVLQQGASCSIFYRPINTTRLVTSMLWHLEDNAGSLEQRLSDGAQMVMALQGGSNALMQEDVMAEVLQHFNTRERLHLATVSRHSRACVAKSWTTANLSGRDLGKELTWLAHCVPPRMLKVTLLHCWYVRFYCWPYTLRLMSSACLQELVVRGGSMPSNMQIHLALSIQPFSTLRSLTLEPERGITLASVATLSSLHQLTSLATNLNHLTSLAPSLAASLNAQNPVDLAEYAHLTGVLLTSCLLNLVCYYLNCCGRSGATRLASSLRSATAGLQRLHILMTNGHQDAGVLLSRKWGALENLTDLELSGWNQLRQEGGASAGALHFLFQHLKRAAFKVGALHGLVQAQLSLATRLLLWSAAVRLGDFAFLCARQEGAQRLTWGGQNWSSHLPRWSRSHSCFRKWCRMTAPAPPLPSLTYWP